MTPSCTGLVELRGELELELLKSTFNAENFVCRSSWSILAILAQFTLEMCVTARIVKNSLKPPILGVQGHLRSLMLTTLKSSSPVLVRISSRSVPIATIFTLDFYFLWGASLPVFFL